LVLTSKFYAYEGLIIAQINIKPWLELLDQVIFKNERLFLGFRKYKVDVGNMSHQIFRICPVIPFPLEIASYPMPEILGLANINHLMLGVLHEINAWRIRKIFQFIG
jgi:hypothetical protein